MSNLISSFFHGGAVQCWTDITFLECNQVDIVSFLHSFNTSKVRVLQYIYLFDTIWIYVKTMQELSHLGKNTLVQYGFRMLLTQIVTQVFKDSLIF